jgi:hypothetical protein
VPVKKAKSSDVTVLQIKANLESLSLTLNKKGRKLSIISLKNSSTAIKFQEDENMLIEVTYPWLLRINIKGTLGNINASDLTPEGIMYPSVLEIYGEHMVDFQVEYFDRYNEKLNCDVMIRLKMNSIRFVYLNRFLSEIELFLKELKGNALL